MEVIRIKELFKVPKTKEIEEGALQILKNYLKSNGISYTLSENDKTPYLDGKINIENRAYDVQIKGIDNDYTEHSIDIKYFDFAQKNFILYILVDNVLKNDMVSNIYYKAINHDDIIKSLQNKTSISVKKLGFNKLDNIDDFADYVSNEFDLFCKRTSVGIDIGIFDTNLLDVKFEGDIKFDKNKDIENINVRSISISSKKTGNEFSSKIDNRDLKVFIQDYKKDDTLILPNTDIQLNRSFNRVLNIVTLTYEDLKLEYNINKHEVNIKINNIAFDIERIEVYENYFKIIQSGNGVENVYLESFDMDFVQYLDTLKRFKEFINPNNLRYGQFDMDSMMLLYNNWIETNAESGITNINGLYVIYMVEDNNIKLIHTPLYINIEFKTKKEVYYIEGYTTLFFDSEISDHMLNIYNIDYVLQLELDKKNISTVYKDEYIGGLIFNYLKIYWNYRHDIDLIILLEEYTRERIKTTDGAYLYVNYIQLKKILDIDLTRDELDKLNGFLENNQDVMLQLGIYIVLENKLLAKSLYKNLDDESKETFRNYPIYKLYERLV